MAAAVAAAATRVVYTEEERALLQALAAAHGGGHDGTHEGTHAGTHAGTHEMVHEGARLQGLRLALMDTEEVRALSVVEVTVPSTFTRNLPTPGGVCDLLMGSTDRQLRCAKCKSACDGHNGHIELAAPVLRMSYVKATVAHLRTCCRVCGRKKWQSHGEGDAAMEAAGVAKKGKRSTFVNAAHIFAKTPPVGHDRIRALADACKNRLTCPWSFPTTAPDGTVVPACGAPQPTYRQSKTNKLVIMQSYGEKQLAAMEGPDERRWALGRADAAWRVVKIKATGVTVRYADSVCNPAEIRSIIASTDVLTLAEMGYRLDPDSIEPGAVPRLLSHPKNFVMEVQLVLPNSVRPSIHLTDGSRCRGEDDLTRTYVSIVRQNNDVAKAAAALHAAMAAADASCADKLAKARAARADAVARVEQAAAEPADLKGHDSKTPALDAELAAAAAGKAAAALEAADEELAAVLLALDDAVRAERDAHQVACDKLAVECAALITPAVRMAVTIEGLKEHRHGRTSRRKQQGLKERLTGKRGRMRGNNLGRRVDQSGRAVVGPDAVHNIWELGVPDIIMCTLTFPERVTAFNVRQLAARVVAGATGTADGAINVLRPDTTGSTTTVSLAMLDAEGRADLAAQLQVGWTVERMMRDGDWVLFNRQPSLHKASMMAFRVYRAPGRTFKLPLPCTSPFNADFDGDEMNMHMLQTWEAIAEAQEIMSVPQQMVASASNSVIIGLVQDALPLARKLTAKDAFLGREEVMQLAMCMQFNLKGGTRDELAAMPATFTHGATGFVDWLGRGGPGVAALRAPGVDAFMPAPAILKGTTWAADGTPTTHGPRWTGKQVVSWTLPAGMCMQRVLDDGTPPADGWVPTRPLAALHADADALAGLEDQAAAAEGKDTGTSKDTGTDKDKDKGKGKDTVALHRRLRAARAASKALASVKSWLDDDAVVVVKDGELLMGRLCKQTVGRVAGGFVHTLWRQYGPWAAAKWVSDAQRVLNLYGMTHTVCISITDCVPPEAIEGKVDALIADAVGRADALLDTRAPAYVIEVRTHKILQALMRAAGAAVLNTMTEDNGIYQISKSGSKGTVANIAQIACLLGPQSVFGNRIRARRSVAGARTLLNFAPDDARVEARGFVANSLLRGLTPSEYFFHMMAAREGVINTSINTSETGYNYNRMVQGEQSAAVMYDGSVRAGNYQLVSLHYGCDDYDGSKLERVNVPAIAWSDAQLRARLGSTLAQLAVETGAAKTETPTQTKAEAEAETEAAAYLEYEAALHVRARDMLRSVRVGLGDTVATHFALPFNLDTLVDAAKLAAAPDTLTAGEPVCDRVLHLARRVYAFLRGVTAVHDALAARKTTPPKPRTTGGARARLEAALTRADDPYTAYGDPGLVARATYLLQLSSGNILRRHNLSSAALDWLLDRVGAVYRRALVAPGEGVGALGAASMGEPSTQLTLNTFHSTGAENITNAPEGLPRFKQLIDAKDTAATAKMTIRFLEPWASSEARVRAFATGAARVLLSEVVVASDIVPCAPLSLAEAGPVLAAPIAPVAGAEDEFAGLRRLLALEALTLATSVAGVVGGGFLAAAQLELETLASDRVVFKVKKAVGKAVEAALLSTPELRGGVKVEALKKRRAAGASSGADAVATAARFVAVLRLNKDALHGKGLTVATVDGAVRRVLAGDATVVAADPLHAAWVLMFRPLDVPSRIGMPAAVWDGLADRDRATIERAVTEAMHDALIEALVVHGHPAITQAVVRAEARHVVNARTGALEVAATWVVDTEGSDLRSVALLPGVDIRNTVTNNVREVNRVLGIEATADILHQQLHAVICTSGPYVDPRHMRMMALVMCRGGVFMPLNRHKLKKMGVAGLLQMASYEQAKEVFEHGALFGEKDPLVGPIEKMIVGQPFNVGTGAFDVRAVAIHLPEPEAFVAPLGMEGSGTAKTDVAAALVERTAQRAAKRTRAMIQACGASGASEASEESDAEDAGVAPLRYRHIEALLPASIDVSEPKRTATRDPEHGGARESRTADDGAGVAPLRPRTTRAALVYEPANPAPAAPVPLELAAAVARVAALAGQVRNAAKYSTLLELEARLGHLTAAGCFAPGVPAVAFRRIEAALEAYKGWTDAPPLVVIDGTDGAATVWQQCTHDVYDLEDGTEARTISAWNLAHEGVIAKTHVCKTELARVDMAVVTVVSGTALGAAPGTAPGTTPGTTPGDALNGLAVRAALHVEEAIHTSRLPARVRPKWVGIKQRKVYKKGAWTFTLTRVWGGATNVEAEAAQVTSLRYLSGGKDNARDVTVYEVEVELVAPGEILEHRSATDASIAHALLARVHDFTGEGSVLVPLDADADVDVDVDTDDGESKGEGEGEGEGVAPLMSDEDEADFT